MSAANTVFTQARQVMRKITSYGLIPTYAHYGKPDQPVQNCSLTFVFEYSVLRGYILQKILLCMNFFLYKQKMLFYQGDRYLWPHCCMNNLYISQRSLFGPTYTF